MKYRIELTEEQMRVLEDCCNQYMRILMGQTSDLANLLTEHLCDAEKLAFERYITKRNAIYEILNSVMRIAFPSMYGVPDEKSEDCMIAECMWDAIRYARGTSRWDKPFQIGDEPTPKIEVIEDD